MILVPEGRPTFSAERAQAFVHHQYGIAGSIKALPGEWDQNFLLDAGPVGKFVLKIANRGHDTAVLEFQDAALEHLARHWPVAKVPRPVSSLAGEFITTIQDGTGGEAYRVRLLTYIHGYPLRSLTPLPPASLERIGAALGEMDRCLADFSHPGMQRHLPWDLRQAEWISAQTHHIPDPGRRAIVERLLLQYRGRVKPLLSGLPMSVIHNDANDDNLLLEQEQSGEWRLVGLYDFGDMLYSHTVNELAVACAYACLDIPDPLQPAASLTAGYHRSRPLSELELRALFPLMCMRLCISVTNSAMAAHLDPLNLHRQVSDRQAWEALERVERIDWRHAESRLRQACGLGALPRSADRQSGWDQEDLLKERRQRIGPSLSLSYDVPLVILRGRGQFLFDQEERAYLDCVNNVSHVGHCHPRVTAALAHQAELLNTNTRYLHPYILEYARRLTAWMPEPLRVCYFVNSGSEANELAVRLARTYTGRREAIVLEGAYHGNTATLVDMSPYKAEGPGGQGLADWAYKVVKPDPYRGPYRGSGEAIGCAYATHVDEVCQRLVAQGCPPGMFFCEPLLGCGGQIVPPEGYLRHAFHHVRAAGGLCVVDEVQVGMGRVGSHMWAFQSHGVTPDIVTLGKPIGNGHPLGAVITTPTIAQAFANGMEYFSTFGGNPVSMAVGLAVLDVIEDEGLRQQAQRVGLYLKEGFLALGERHEEIGDVRGLGLFMGVEMVLDRATLEPATALTAQLIEMARVDGVLLSSEGPFHNVLKIKPPMQFNETDADLLLGAVDRALDVLSRRP
jgi:4-aminobutyrate aminotransferase-like enzyme/Ser/Thr protein kinase RdoA (MazF antagonist)